MSDTERLVWAAWSTADGGVRCTSWATSGEVAVRALALEVVHMVSLARHQRGMAPEDAIDTVWAALKLEFDRHVREGRLGTYGPANFGNLPPDAGDLR